MGEPLVTPRVFREGETYVAVDDESDAVGFGETEAQAVLAVLTDNWDLHQHLNVLGDEDLGPHLIAIKRVLQSRYA